MSILLGGNGDFIGSLLNGIWMGGFTGLGAVSGYLTTPKGFNRFNANHLPQTTLEAPTAGIKPMVTPNKGIDNLTLRGLEVTEVSSDLSLAQEHIFVIRNRW